MSVINLAFGSFAWGNTIQDILLQWETMGIFEYVLPALLIFAVVFGILMKSGVLGDNRGVNVVISLAAALLAMQSFTLRSFFRIIWPYAGIGIAILLVFLILGGLFYSEKNWFGYVFFGIGMFVAVVVVISSLSSYEWEWGWWLEQYWGALATLAIIGLLITIVAVSSSKKENKKGP